jgi:hypothetical protein
MAKTTAKSLIKTPDQPTPEPTKKDRVLALLRREGGATLDDVVAVTSWLPHSARAVFTGLRRKGYAIDCTRKDGVSRYSLAAEPTA